MRPLLATLLLLAACDPATCPAGTTRTGGVCTRANAAAGDASAQDGAAPDDAGDAEGAKDAGACACGAEAPVCSDGACVGCTRDAECTEFAGAPRCVAGGCVACSEHADCTDPTRPACDASTHTCVACTEVASGPDEACAHFSGTPVCSAGACVECTTGKDEACGSGVCNAEMKTCDAGRTKRSKTVCNVCVPGAAACTNGSACVSDAECQAGQACVADKAGAGERVCMTVATSDELCVRPFFSKSDVETSADGASVVVCTYATRTTCQAQRDWNKRCGIARVDNPDLDVEGSADDARCGAPSVQDGQCVKYLSQHLCTVPCINSVIDCPRGASSCVPDDRIAGGGRCSND